MLDACRLGAAYPGDLRAGHRLRRIEHATTGSNVAAGEQVRWLPRRAACGLLLPASDYWVFDTRLVRFAFFSGDGQFLATELCNDPVIAEQCTATFEAVWERAVPHGKYQPR